MRKMAVSLAAFLIALQVLSTHQTGINGSPTHVTEQVTNNAQDDFRPSICADSFGRPHIAWIRWQTPFEIYYAIKEESHWNISKIKTLDPAVFHCMLSLSLDSEGKPHIAYLTETSRWDLRYLYWNQISASWVEEDVANGGSNSHFNKVNLMVDSTLTPHIIWSARWGGGLFGVFYSTKVGGNWIVETIAHSDDAGPHLYVDHEDVPHVLWFNMGGLPNCELRYGTRADGTWTWEVVRNDHFSNGERGLFVDSNGVPHIAFSNFNHSSNYFEAWYGTKSLGSWSFRPVALSLPFPFHDPYPSIALDGSSGVVYIVWNHFVSGVYTVHLATLDEHDFSIEQVGIGVADEWNPSLCVDSQSRVHIAWNSPFRGSGLSEIYYAIAYRHILSTIDIDPDTLNLGSKGEFITAYIELPEGYDVANIDVSTLLLNDTVSAELLPICVGDFDSDGIPDLMVKFDRAAVIEHIRANTAFIDRFMIVTLTVSGTLNDGTMLQGTDTIKIIVPKSEILPN